MAFTPQQLTGLTAAYARQQQGTANPTDVANLSYATKQGWTAPTTSPTASISPSAAPPTVPGSPTANTPVTPAVTSPTAPVTPTANLSPTPGTMEEKPGVFKASSLSDFYQNEIANQRTQYEAAQKQAQAAASSLSNLKPVDYQGQFNQQYQNTVAPIDQNIQQITQQVGTLDNALRNLEDDVRAEIGGRAPESIVQAEIARRAKPLTLQRAGLVDQVQNLASQKESLMSNIERQLGFQQQQFQDQRALYQQQQSLAKDTMDSFNTLIEKGALATNKEKDNARQLFTTFLEQSPDFLKSLTQDEINQMNQGIVPFTALSKLGDTLKEQQLAQQKAKETGGAPKVIGSAARGFLQWDEAQKKWIPISTARAVALGGGTGGGGGGAAPVKIVSTPTAPAMTFEQYLDKRQNEAGMTFNPQKRAEIKREFDNLNKIQSQGTQTPNIDITKFDPQVQNLITGVYSMNDLAPTDKRRLAAQIAQAKNAGLLTRDGNASLTDITKQRTSFNNDPVVKVYKDVEASYAKVNSTSPNAAGDISMIYAYMKMLDPGSVVREGEFATAQNAAGIPDRIRNSYNAAIQGTRLNENQRSQFRGEAKNIYNQYRGRYDSVVKTYSDTAKKYGIAPEDIIPGGVGLSQPTGSIDQAKSKYGISY